MDGAPTDLLGRIRDELYHAKSLVRATRNHTKTTAAALQDSEERLDGLITELESMTNPNPEEDQGGNEDPHEEAEDEGSMGSEDGSRPAHGHAAVGAAG